MSPVTSESAPITEPSPMVAPGITNTRHGSQTLLPRVTGANVTGYPSNALSQDPWVKMRQCPPMPVSSPITTGLVGLMYASWSTMVRLPRANRDSGSCGPPTNTCSRIFASSPISITRHET